MIAPETLSAIAAAVQIDASLVALRTTFPGVHFSECDEDDIPARIQPVLTAGDYNLYLVASGSHCLQLTNDEQAAAGVVVAARIDEE